MLNLSVIKVFEVDLNLGMIMKKKFLRKQKGMSLLEVIVSMLICGIGLAGTISAIQASQRLATSADYRAIATREIQSIVDMMRANRLGANVYVTKTSGNQAFGDAGMALCKDRTPDDSVNQAGVNTPRGYCLSAKAKAEAVAEQEVNRWSNRVRNALPAGEGKIDAENKGGIYVFTVNISWDIGNENKNVATNPVRDSIQMSFSL